MNDSDFITVFDVANTGYRDWWFPAFGLIFIVIGAILPRLFEAGLFPEYQKKMFGGWFPKLWLGFAISWTAIVFITTFGAYVKDRESLISGKAGYVEGIVTNFIPMPYQGHAQESFNVDGVPFNYSDYGVTAGFNNSASHGGQSERDSTFVSGIRAMTFSSCRFRKASCHKLSIRCLHQQDPLSCHFPCSWCFGLDSGWEVGF